jgi:hypothetical protein
MMDLTVVSELYSFSSSFPVGTAKPVTDFVLHLGERPIADVELRGIDVSHGKLSGMIEMESASAP